MAERLNSDMMDNSELVTRQLNDVASVIRDMVGGFAFSNHEDELGRVVQVGNGIAQVAGLRGCMSGELIEFEDNSYGIAMNLDEATIGTVLLSGGESIYEGGFASRTSRVAMMPVGDALKGRVVNALGQPIDQKGNILSHQLRPIERVAPGVIARQAVDVPLLTGIKAIDAMVPIGRGQRQLIIGDRQVGKTAIAVDTIINQKDSGVICVYVAIGQKNSTVAGLVNTLSEYGALEYTCVVVAGASEPAALQYLAPYSGIAAAEYWMESGHDVLIVFDDLSKHAVAYRTMSLLLRRPPGREAYPGDVFYLHSRLLERAGRLNKDHGGGSITALPIIETQAGDMSAYIPTNVISITDGQIYLETESFNAGIRPAINPGLSVSRVGGAAQVRAMKRIAGPMRIELAQYRELASFMQFSSDLDEQTRERLRQGERVVEIFKQPQFRPLSLVSEIIILFAAQQGCLSDIKIEDTLDFEYRLLEHIHASKAEIAEEISREYDITPDLSARLLDIINDFKATYSS